MFSWHVHTSILNDTDHLKKILKFVCRCSYNSMWPESQMKSCWDSDWYLLMWTLIGAVKRETIGGKEDNVRYSRRTSSLHSTESSPLSLTALHVYTPPSNRQGLRISSVRMPCLLIIRYLASFEMSILFLYQVTLGWQGRTQINRKFSKLHN